MIPLILFCLPLLLFALPVSSYTFSLFFVFMVAQWALFFNLLSSQLFSASFYFMQTVRNRRNVRWTIIRVIYFHLNTECRTQFSPIAVAMDTCRPYYSSIIVCVFRDLVEERTNILICWPEHKPIESFSINRG